MTSEENEKNWNSYFYPNTEVLINNYNIKDNEELKKVEVVETFKKLYELSKCYPEKECNKEYLRELHKFIFEKIYPFAGEYRKVNMMKRYGTFLTISEESKIDDYLDLLFNEVNSLLLDPNGDLFSIALATLYTRLIYCHPFREGNGRAIREFVREFSIQKSNGKLELDWSLIDFNKLNKYIEIAHIYPAMTSEVFKDAIVPYEKNSNKGLL